MKRATRTAKRTATRTAAAPARSVDWRTAESSAPRLLRESGIKRYSKRTVGGCHRWK